MPMNSTFSEGSGVNGSVYGNCQAPIRMSGAWAMPTVSVAVLVRSVRFRLIVSGLNWFTTSRLFCFRRLIIRTAPSR